jgi:hypothetical protein
MVISSNFRDLNVDQKIQALRAVLYGQGIDYEEFIAASFVYTNHWGGNRLNKLPQEWVESNIKMATTLGGVINAMAHWSKVSEHTKIPRSTIEAAYKSAIACDEKVKYTLRNDVVNISKIFRV